MNKTTADRPHDAPGFTPTRSLRFAAQATGAYRRIFASSLAAQILSRPSPVRYSGFDMTLDVKSVRFECDDVLSVTLTRGKTSPCRRGSPALTSTSFSLGKATTVFAVRRPRRLDLVSDRRPEDRRGWGGSREIHESLKPGMVVDVRGPRNAFPFVAAPSYLFVAGGIGITPLLPMVQRCHRRGIPWRLDYLGRTRTAMPFLHEIEEYSSGRVTIRPDDESGPLDVETLVSAAKPGAAVYTCGPAR
ncbi:hypothetical protein GCM10020255_103150 [Rhodococcus baikonurensis]